MFWRSSSSEVGCLLVLAIVVPILLVMKLLAGVGAPSDYRYKITLYVDTPTGVRSYSGVREVKYMSDFSLEGQKQHREDQKADAIPIKLPDGRVYFAIADEDIHPQHAALESAARKIDPRAARADLPLWRVKGEHDLPSLTNLYSLTQSHWDKDKVVRTWPTIVTFDDPNEPTSIRVVDPSIIPVSRATIQITDEKPTSEIDSYFAADFWDRWRSYKETAYRGLASGDTEALKRPAYRHGPEDFGQHR